MFGDSDYKVVKGSTWFAENGHTRLVVKVTNLNRDNRMVSFKDIREDFWENHLPIDFFIFRFSEMM